MKGKSEKVASYELLSQRERLYRARGERSHSIFSALVGREEAWQTLQSELAALRAGRGGIAAVVADAGLGKTRLVDELRRSLEAEDIGWQEGRAVSIGRTLAYHAIADLLRSWAGITEDDEDQSARTSSKRRSAAPSSPTPRPCSRCWPRSPASASGRTTGAGCARPRATRWTT